MDQIHSYPKTNPTKSERQWVLIFAIIVMVITTLPYIVGYQNSTEDWEFTGFVFNLEDNNDYLAKMLRGSTGEWLFRNPYSAPPQEGVLAYSFYIWLGKLASAPAVHEQLVGIFHLSRFVGGIFAVISMYEFGSIFIESIRFRRFSIIMIGVGGGFGWFMVLIGQPLLFGSLPLDFYSPESFSFLMLYGIPHLIIARALFFWGLVIYLRHIYPSHSFKFQKSIYTGLIWLLLGLVQPIIVILAWGLISLHFFINFFRNIIRKQGYFVQQLRLQKARAANIFIITLVSSPIVIYMVLLYAFPGMGAQWFSKIWRSQVILLSPHPLHYLIAFGLPLIFIIYYLFHGKYEFHDIPSFAFYWVIALPFLVYSPLNIQRRLAEGVWVVLIVLIYMGMENSNAKFSKALPAAVAAISLPTTLFLLIGGVQVGLKPSEPAFIPKDNVSAYEFLADVSDSENVIMSSYPVGNSLPAWSPNFVVIGHGADTIDFHQTMEEVKSFYQVSTMDDFRLNLIDRYSVDYVIWGENERDYGNWYPGDADYLVEIYSNETTSLFEVRLP